MLQAELSHELRVHVWHPKLVRMPAGKWRAVHDHRFAITSAVIVGKVIDVPHIVVIDDGNPLRYASNPTYERTEMWEIRHAKIQDRTPADAAKVSECYVKALTPVVYEAGDVYQIRRRDFHTTIAPDCAVTLIHRSDFDKDHARVLGAGESIIVKDDSEVMKKMRSDVLAQARMLLRESYAKSQADRDSSTRVDA